MNDTYQRVALISAVAASLPGACSPRGSSRQPSGASPAWSSLPRGSSALLPRRKSGGDLWGCQLVVMLSSA
eukprot:gene2328-biopygen18520